MSKYIDADKLDKKFNEILDNPKEYDKPIHDMLREFYFAPTEDVKPVRHGHWEQEQPQYRLYKCSACSKVCFAEAWGDETVLYDYCPNCGARMDGEK